MNLSSNKFNSQTVKQLEALGSLDRMIFFHLSFSILVSSASLRTILSRVDLFDQAVIDDLLAY